MILADPETSLVVAGPGGGKTHNMVSKIIDCIEKLSQARFLAVITYTNAATVNIKSRIEKEISIPQNVFIGTTHSFLIRFIFDPYAHLHGITLVEKHYIDAAKVNYIPKNDFARKADEKNIAENLVKKGIITYDKILEKSLQLLNDKAILRLVTARLQYIFVDEYQDSRVYQHLIIQKVLEAGKTTVYCIGDPLQSIFKFTYLESQLKKESQPKEFKETPLLDFIEKRGQETTYITNNHRSSAPIVSLINKYTSVFNPQFQQTAVGMNANVNLPVCFILENNVKAIIDRFDHLKLSLNVTEEPGHKNDLFLSYRWKLFESVATERNINRLVKNNDTTANSLSSIMRLVGSIIGLQKSEIISITLTELNYRKFCISIAKLIRQKDLHDDNFEEFIRTNFKKVFGKTLQAGHKGNISISGSLSELMSVNMMSESANFYSTIHSAKGLEATSVLVCANTKDQLIKWLSVDQVMAYDDDFRMGYVAFSRARKFLAIACLQKLDEPTLKILDALDICYNH